MLLQTTRPTLWRTCRVLANSTRLRLFAQLMRQQPQTVLQLGESLALTPPVASQSLRALEARGLLKVRRVQRRVEYRIPGGNEAGVSVELVSALRGTLLHDTRSVEQVIRIATAFTHPTRIEIYQQLHSGPLTQVELKTKLGVSWPALSRHLAKLLRRGYVVLNEPEACYAITPHSHLLGRVLAKLALA